MIDHKRFPKEWIPLEFDARNMTKWNWMCQYHENLVLAEHTDIGAFTLLNARYGIEIQEDVQIGSHCSIYSWSTIDDKKGKVTIKRNARIGSHSLVMPDITIGENAIVGACSFVNKNIPANVVAYGIPVKIIRRLDNG